MDLFLPFAPLPEFPALHPDNIVILWHLRIQKPEYKLLTFYLTGAHRFEPPIPLRCSPRRNGKAPRTLPFLS